MDKPLAWKPGENLELLEREALTRTLEKFEGNKSQAARALGISFVTVQRKIRRLNISAPGKTHGRPPSRKNRTI